MHNRNILTLTKWPFLLGDFLLVALAAVIIHLSNNPIQIWQALACLGCVGVGAWLGVLPFLQEYQAEVKLSETSFLAGKLDRIQNLERIADQIGSATSQWQSVQEQAARTSKTAKEVTESIAIQAKAFTEFQQKASDTEKGNLRLEVEKLRRAESEWLQIVIRLLDHTYALTQAAVRSGKAGLIEQLVHFQNACRDVARRVGLVPFVVVPNEVYDEKVHQLVDCDGNRFPNAKVAETIATGFTYQGQLLRRAVVALQSETSPDAAPRQQEGTEGVGRSFPSDEPATQSSS
jgi:molecular chaperone GrpE (heat shock protein)